MAKKDFTKTSKILIALLAAHSAIGEVVMSKHEWRLKMNGKQNSFESYRNTVNYLTRKGYIRMVDKNNERFMSLTKKGELEALLAKAKEIPNTSWDGKWRVVMFDIPEDSHKKRDMLRNLLKKQKFYKLQASVYISPHPFNREAIAYLKETNLIEYIRILKVEEMDSDKKLREHFKL